MKENQFKLQLVLLPVLLQKIKTFGRKFNPQNIIDIKFDEFTEMSL